MRAEEDRAAFGGRLDPRQEVPDRRPDRGAGVVLVRLQAEIAQVRGDDVRHGTLLARRAWQRRQLGEQIDDIGGHGAILWKGHVSEAAGFAAKRPFPDTSESASFRSAH
jgi:hypothetical protein